MGRREQQIQKAIEAKGYEVYDLHYERPGMHLEKGGQEGGWYADTDGGSLCGWTFQDVLNEVADMPHADDYFEPVSAAPAESGAGDGRDDDR